MNTTAIIILVVVLVVVGVVACAAVATEPLFHFWKSQHDRELGACMKHKPFLNYSSSGENHCYTTYWSEYCKIRDPSNCPKSALNTSYQNEGRK